MILEKQTVPPGIAWRCEWCGCHCEPGETIFVNVSTGKRFCCRYCSDPQVGRQPQAAWHTPAPTIEEAQK